VKWDHTHQNGLVEVSSMFSKNFFLGIVSLCCLPVRHDVHNALGDFRRKTDYQTLIGKCAKSLQV